MLKSLLRIGMRSAQAPTCVPHNFRPNPSMRFACDQSAHETGPSPPAWPARHANFLSTIGLQFDVQAEVGGQESQSANANERAGPFLVHLRGSECSAPTQLAPSFMRAIGWACSATHLLPLFGREVGCRSTLGGRRILLPFVHEHASRLLAAQPR
jgi:hypothetical protein